MLVDKQALLNLGCFSRKEAYNLIGSKSEADALIANCINEGLIGMISKNLYVVYVNGYKIPLSSKYQIATKIFDDSYLTHHSAFEYYGCANQVYHEVYVSGSKRFTSFEFDQTTYKYVLPRISLGIVFDNKLDVRVTDPERTILDGIKDFDRIGGFEELWKCLDIMSIRDIQLNEDKFLCYLAEYNQQFLVRKVGYILSMFKNKFGLSERFFSECKKMIGSEKTHYYFSQRYRAQDMIFNKEWNLYVLRNLYFFVGKGMPFDCCDV